MRNALNVTFSLDRLVCYDEADGWGSAEPYMWTVFFKIDGTTCRLNDSLMLEGTATVFTTPGSHGNLDDNDVDAGDTVQIPDAIGFQQMTLIPIPVPDFVKQAGTDDVASVAGCIVVLMEEDNVSDDGAEAGHQALNNAIQNALNSIIPTLGFTKQDISEDDINQLTDKVQAQVEDAVQNQQNFFENIWSWLNPDDTIGTVVWKFSGDDLLKLNPTLLEQRWPNEQHPSNDNGDWEIFGSINTTELPGCPANAANDIFSNLFGESNSNETMQAMYHFRNTEMKKHGGLSRWWQLAQRNAVYLKYALKEKEIAHAAYSIFKEIPSILNNREQPIADHHFENAAKLLKHIKTGNIRNRKSRIDIERLTDALYALKGKTAGEIINMLSVIAPARYPFKKYMKRK